MSTCISRHGEYGDHVGNALYCERCGALSERRLDALEEVVEVAREYVRLWDAPMPDDYPAKKAIFADMDTATGALKSALATLDGA